MRPARTDRCAREKNQTLWIFYQAEQHISTIIRGNSGIYADLVDVAIFIVMTSAKQRGTKWKTHVSLLAKNDVTIVKPMEVSSVLLTFLDQQQSSILLETKLLHSSGGDA